MWFCLYSGSCVCTHVCALSVSLVYQNVDANKFVEDVEAANEVRNERPEADLNNLQPLRVSLSHFPSSLPLFRASIQPLPQLPGPAFVFSSNRTIMPSSHHRVPAMRLDNRCLASQGKTEKKSRVLLAESELAERRSLAAVGQGQPGNAAQQVAQSDSPCPIRIESSRCICRPGETHLPIATASDEFPIARESSLPRDPQAGAPPDSKTWISSASGVRPESVTSGDHRLVSTGGVHRADRHGDPQAATGPGARDGTGRWPITMVSAELGPCEWVGAGWTVAEEHPSGSAVAQTASACSRPASTLPSSPSHGQASSSPLSPPDLRGFSDSEALDVRRCSVPPSSHQTSSIRWV